MKALQREITAENEPPRDFEPMLATLIDEPFSNAEWVFEPKYDGVRAVGYIIGGNLELVTRNGKEVAFRYPELASLVDHVKGDVVLDGEIVAFDEEGRSKFQSLQQRIGLESEEDIIARSKIWPASYAVFDIIWKNGRDLRDLPLIERRKILEDTVSPGGPLILSPQIDTNGEDAYKQAFEAKLEGIIAKHKDSNYYTGRSREWLKIKTVRRQEVVIGGWTEPRRTRPLLGALVVGLYGNDSRLHWVGNVGGGFTHASLKQVYNLLQPLARDDSPFIERVQSTEPVHWVEPKLVCEVKFSEWTKDSHLRQPIFMGLRDDKPPEDCRMEQAEETSSAVEKAEESK